MTPETQAKLDSRLINAARSGYTETVKLLLATGADVHASDDWALRWAARSGHTETVKELLAADADVHADDDWALCWATCNGYTETVKVLLEAIKSQNAQRLELERQLLGGTGLMLAESRPEHLDSLLRQAFTEQSAPSKPNRGEYIALPLCH